MEINKVIDNLYSDLLIIITIIILILIFTLIIFKKTKSKRFLIIATIIFLSLFLISIRKTEDKAIKNLEKDISSMIGSDIVDIARSEFEVIVNGGFVEIDSVSDGKDIKVGILSKDKYIIIYKYWGDGIYLPE